MSDPYAGERAEFMKAIVSDPAEDTHRLVFADWLEEHGESERGEFIRVQVELANIDAVFASRGRKMRQNELTRMTKRESKLWVRERALWIDGLIAHCKPSSWPELVLHRWSDRPNYTPRHPEGYSRRGFVEEIACTAEDWLSHADALCWHPGQTVECHECNDSDIKGMIPYTDSKGVSDHFLCGMCAPPGVTGYRRGTGFISRPFPSTAQPITNVNLTTMPQLEELRVDTDVVEFSFAGRQLHRLANHNEMVFNADGMRVLLEIEFPGITFTLPPTPVVL